MRRTRRQGIWQIASLRTDPYCNASGVAGAGYAIADYADGFLRCAAIREVSHQANAHIGRKGRVLDNGAGDLSLQEQQLRGMRTVVNVQVRTISASERSCRGIPSNDKIASSLAG